MTLIKFESIKKCKYYQIWAYQNNPNTNQCYCPGGIWVPHWTFLTLTNWCHEFGCMYLKTHNEICLHLLINTSTLVIIRTYFLWLLAWLLTYQCHDFAGTSHWYLLINSMTLLALATDTYLSMPWLCWH